MMAGVQKVHVDGGRPRSFYASMGLIAIMLAVAGFGPSIAVRSNRLGPLTLVVVIHAVLFVAWLLLFLTQTVLAATGRIGTHRRLGILGVALASAMLVSACMTSVQLAQRGVDLSGDLGGATANMPVVLGLALGDIAAFAVVVAAGLGFRRRPEVHKRLMLLATVSPFTLMGAPLTHLRGHWPGAALATVMAALLLLFSNVIHDRVTEGRVHAVSWWGSLSLLAWSLVRATLIIPSASWRSIAAWLAQ
jgi:hypothetical protein